jgi:hypothetical protein
MRLSLVRVASLGRDTASRILESDLEQIALILTTLVASTTYGWIEGFAIQQPRYEATQIWWILGHFSTYSVAMTLLFACITGGFGLLKARSMFIRGKRYFLFTFAGNFPFSWLVEDFAFFWFSPDYRLTSERWTNWFLGGVWILDPWRTGVKIWIPNWYWPVLVFWLAMMWYAHRCTVYDALVKDEIARDIVPCKIEIPRIRETPAPEAERVSVEPPTGKREIPQAPAEAPQPEQPPTQQPTLEPFSIEVRSGWTRPPEPRKRSREAEEALQRLREKWLKDGSDANKPT